ncbi:hypothetical protein RRG08_055215 [Elysia crispata]|uniref:Uncharacterized protein n=1 Tax=Elysia crispata TaxID=231223 RepID=A0AAE0XSS9_9GAST|nr:hypothetical protein RRG08_055215 [Elysia crispata]
MELSSSTILALFVAVASISLVHSLPTRAQDVLQETSGMTMDKRPKYMDTRRDLDIFKDLVLMSIQELVDEERLNPAVLSEDETDKHFQTQYRTYFVEHDSLVDEERLNPAVLSEDETDKGVEKRAYMGICVRRQHNQIRHFPCLRSGR